MKKIYILEKTLILILIAIALISLSHLVMTSKVILNSPNEYSYTKAICNTTNYCEDYLIECEGNKIKQMTLTGFSLQQDLDWIDPREKKINFCD